MDEKITQSIILGFQPGVVRSNDPDGGGTAWRPLERR